MPGETVNRDRTAFAQVFAQHRDDVVGLAFVLSGDAETARDAAAEAFARTYEQWRRGNVDRVEGYVRRAVVNQVNSHLDGWAASGGSSSAVPVTPARPPRTRSAPPPATGSGD